MTRSLATLLILPAGKAAGLGARLDRSEEELVRAGPAIREVVDTPADVPDRIVQLSDRIDPVAVGDGDGTPSICASALKATGLPLIVLPLGTANDLARTLGLPLDPVRAAAVPRTGHVVDLDLGEVDGHYFVTSPPPKGGGFWLTA